MSERMAEPPDGVSSDGDGTGSAARRPTSLAAESGAGYELPPLLDALASASASEATTAGCRRCHTLR